MNSDTAKRLLELSKDGCPGCGNKDNFDVTCTEVWFRDVVIKDGHVEWGDAVYGYDVSDDYINCKECDWEEKLGGEECCEGLVDE